MNIPTFSQNSDPALRKLDRFIEWFLLTLILCVTLLVCCSCGSTKVVTQTVRDVSVDTVYLSNVQYDSIYIFQERTSDYHMNPLNPLKPSETDTVFIKDVSVEYRWLDFLEHHTDFDLLILEHSHGEYWIHVSCKSDRSRNRHQVIHFLLK